MTRGCGDLSSRANLVFAVLTSRLNIRKQAGIGNTHLPNDDSSLLCAQEKYISTERDTADALRKVDDSLLVPLRSRVDVDGGLVLLSGEDMSVGHSQPTTRDRALLQNSRGGMGRVESVFIYAGVFGNGGVVGQRGPGDRHEIRFSQHGLV